MYRIIDCPTFPTKVTKIIVYITIFAFPSKLTFFIPISLNKYVIRPLAGLSKKFHTILITTIETITGK